MPLSLLEAGAEAASTAIDFTDAFTSSVTGIQADFVKYALIAIPVGLAIWAAPQVIKLVKTFFKSLTH
ncbi:MAG: hypothetical protein NC313_16640 [Butyrivibrio sp.]|nr:hypothetical protein [Butyrivibrio sp.]